MAGRPAPPVLAEIVARSQARLRELRRRASPGELRRAALAAPPPRSLREALERTGVGVIAELKRRSPSGGELRPQLEPGRLAPELERAGAAALSVLTEPESFGGTLGDLDLVRRVAAVPVLRKDFLQGPEQVLEARASGADAVLLIVRTLGLGELRACLEACGEVGVDALVEVHDQQDLEVAAAAGASIIGINNRDLDRLTVDLETTVRLARVAPERALLVSESGIRDRADLAQVAAAGVAAVLVGESLMRAASPAARLAELVRAGAGEAVG